MSLINELDAESLMETQYDSDRSAIGDPCAFDGSNEVLHDVENGVEDNNEVLQQMNDILATQCCLKKCVDMF